VSQSPSVDPRAILIRTRFSYRQASFPGLLIQIGLRAAVVLALLLILFAIWNGLHLWPSPSNYIRY
jgi:hypothetical protein